MVASNGCLRERNNLDGIIIMQDLIAKMGLLCDVGRTCLVCVNKLLLAVEITVAQKADAFQVGPSHDSPAPCPSLYRKNNQNISQVCRKKIRHGNLKKCVRALRAAAHPAVGAHRRSRPPAGLSGTGSVHRRRVGCGRRRRVSLKQPPTCTPGPGRPPRTGGPGRTADGRALPRRPQARAEQTGADWRTAPARRRSERAEPVGGAGRLQAPAAARRERAGGCHCAARRRFESTGHIVALGGYAAKARASS